MLIFIGCSDNKIPDVSHVILPNMDIERLDLKLRESAHGNETNFVENLSDHGYFMPYYVYELIGLKAHPDSLENFLQLFMKEKDIQELADSVALVFKDPLPEIDDFNEAFRFFHYYCPNYPLPKPVFFLFEFNYVMVPLKEKLYIAPDQYLGENSLFLSHLPQYIRKRRERIYLVPDALKAWLTLEFKPEPNENTPTLSDEIIHLGRVQWVLDHILPKSHDTIRFGYTLDELNFCKENESSIWRHLLDKELLYIQDENTIQKYTGESPFTPGMPSETPGRALLFIGRAIVSAYMKQNPTQNMLDLLTMPTSQLLYESNYRPK
jgi:hypothetical protein